MHFEQITNLLLELNYEEINYGVFSTLVEIHHVYTQNLITVVMTTL
jgi:hypothetical protein